MSPLVPEYSLLALIAAFLAGLVVGRLTGALGGRSRAHEISSRRIPANEHVELLPEDARIEIQAMLADGRKIEAIRVCRSALGLDLVDAKAAVDLIERMNAPGARAT